MRSLYWFRSDLRCADNLCLAEALSASEQLIAVFILTPETWKAHAAADCKIQFLLDNLRVLSEALSEQGVPLLIRMGPSFSDCPRVLGALCDEYKIDALYFSHEYALDESRRDALVMTQLGQEVKINGYHQQLVLPPGAVMSQQGTAFKVFTPFKKKWLDVVREAVAWRVASGRDSQLRKTGSHDIQPDVVPDTIQGFAVKSIQADWPAGEAAAKRKLKAFCDKSIDAYGTLRDIPHAHGTSALSPYLVQGVISPRQCISLAMAACGLSDFDEIATHEGLSIWVSELIWRDFYHHILYFHPDMCRHKPFKLKTDNIPWSDNKAHLDAWKKGMTGFPLVDAGMRQLLHTGWMHNRLRMVTAMFLSKILLLDWRLGERHFMRHLIDGDFAANNGGWQWCASTGTDAVPYFRIFNPITQSQRFDASGDFIRAFCPELSHLDNRVIHHPFALGVKTEDLDYPLPIVNYKIARQQTIDLFKQL